MRDLIALKFKRDAFRGRKRVPCFWCDRGLTWDLATVDHVVSVQCGGESEPENLEVACRPCNGLRGVVTQLVAFLRLTYEPGTGWDWWRWHGLRESRLGLLADLEALCHRKLTGWRLQGVLAEIDEILAAERPSRALCAC